MESINTKTLLKFTFDQMKKLDEKKIEVEEAKAQGSLIKQANNLLRYELDRSKTLMSIKQHNEAYDDDIKLREIEE